MTDANEFSARMSPEPNPAVTDGEQKTGQVYAIPGERIAVYKEGEGWGITTDAKDDLEDIVNQIAKKLDDELRHQFSTKGIKGNNVNSFSECISKAVVKVLTDEFDLVLKEKPEHRID